MLHLTKGHFSPWLRPDIVSSIITGTRNKDNMTGRMSGKKGRLPVTPLMLRTLKRNLKASKVSRMKKRLIWVVATWAWNGAFRIHEILLRNKTSFDITTDLTGKDVSRSTVTIGNTTTKCIRVHLKAPKEDKLQEGVTIDLFPIEGEAGWMCPIAAYEKWKADKGTKPSPNLPVFRQSDGSAYTGRDFNRDLGRLLGTEAASLGGTITSHSFRSGLASAMALAGYQDSEIMSIGDYTIIRATLQLGNVGILELI